MKYYRAAPLAVFTMLALNAVVASAAPIGFAQSNLASSVPGLAANFDPNLKNPWGMSYSATSPFWLSDQVTNVSTLYNFAGVPQALVVSVPQGAPGPTGPTGQAFVGGQGFVTDAGPAASFVFASLQGTISAWNAGTTAVTQFTATDRAIYTGLTVAGANLYAADAANGKIDVFNNTFDLTTLPGAFRDPVLPAGFVPYNIQNINGKLYVTYFMRGQPGGFVAVFDQNGNFLQHIADAHLNSPWGVAIAPAGFGQFANALLVGNFGDGMINAFDPVTGAFLGTLTDAFGNPLINDGLWAIGFRAPGGTFDPNALYFTAGIRAETEGLFGAIRPVAVPEPMTLSLFGFGLAASAFARRRRRVS
jgi:uncharacterized protein (TIGR03118 family)